MTFLLTDESARLMEAADAFGATKRGTPERKEQNRLLLQSYRAFERTGVGPWSVERYRASADREGNTLHVQVRL